MKKKTPFLYSTLALTFMLAGLLLAASPARAEVTKVSSDTWSVLFDSTGKPAAGISGVLCYKLTFKSGATDSVCTPGAVTTDNNGQLRLSGVATSWSGGDRPANYQVTFMTDGRLVTGGVPQSLLGHPDGSSEVVRGIWAASCNDKRHEDNYGRGFQDTSCTQTVHFEFRLPPNPRTVGAEDAEANGAKCVSATAPAVASSSGRSARARGL